MNIKNIMLATLLIFISGNAIAMHSTVTIQTNSYPYSYPTVPMAPYYPTPVVTYVPTYYTPTYYSYWPVYSYDDYYYDYYYSDFSPKTFFKACAITGVFALALALIGAIANH